MTRALVGLAVLSMAAQAEEWQKPDELVRALALKRSDVVAVLEPEPFLAPLISSRVRSMVAMDHAAEHSVDVVVLYDVLHGMDHRTEFYGKLHRTLQFGGRVVNIDFSEDPPSVAPPKSRLTEAQAFGEFRLAGFRIQQTINLLRYQYFQVFE
jgi:hypothetical protein